MHGQLWFLCGIRANGNEKENNQQIMEHGVSTVIMDIWTN